MERRKLGRSDIEVSPLGIACVGKPWNRMAEEQWQEKNRKSENC